MNRYWDSEENRREYVRMEALEQRKRDNGRQSRRDRYSAVREVATGIWAKLIGLIGLVMFVIIDTGRMHP